MSHFPGDHEIEVEGCKCCDICAQACLCSGLRGACVKNLHLDFTSVSKSYQYDNHRIVSPEQNKLLESKLYEYQHVLKCI